MCLIVFCFCFLYFFQVHYLTDMLLFSGRQLGCSSFFLNNET